MMRKGLVLLYTETVDESVGQRRAERSPAVGSHLGVRIRFQ